jgi:hypothetical protein
MAACQVTSISSTQANHGQKPGPFLTQEVASRWSWSFLLAY